LAIVIAGNRIMTLISTILLSAFLILVSTSPWFWSKKAYYVMWVFLYLFFFTIEYNYIQKSGFDVLRITGYLIFILAAYVPIKMCSVMKISIADINRLKHYEKFLADNSLTTLKYKVPIIIGYIVVVISVIMSIYLYSKGHIAN
jgi:hypothetical protein